MDQFSTLTEQEFTTFAMTSCVTFRNTRNETFIGTTWCEYVGVKRRPTNVACILRKKVKIGYAFDIDGGILMDYTDKNVEAFFTGLKICEKMMAFI